MTIIKKLTVTTDDERKQWIEMLKLASDYHYDMSGQFAPEIIGDTEMEEVFQQNTISNNPHFETIIH